MEKNNQLLQVNTTDLTLLHHPCSTPEQSIQRWLELEAALAAGLTKVIFLLSCVPMRRNWCLIICYSGNWSVQFWCGPLAATHQ